MIRIHPTRLSLLLLAVLALAAAPRGAIAADQVLDLPPRYHAAGMDSWDFWYARSGGLYYAFYLQSPREAPVRFTNSTIGMATSPDLIHWTEYGEVIRANPPGQWNDLWVATGSTWRMNGRWYTLFTGQSRTVYQGVTRGLGLAVSDDLQHWTRVGEGPVQLIRHAFAVPRSRYWQDRGYAAGSYLTYTVLADPYVMPEPIDGWYYMVINSLLDGAALEQRGCLGMFRSRDGLVWEDIGIIAHPKIFDQMEAAQLWKHGDLWYLLFGAARADPVYRATMVFTSASMFGPFEATPRPEINLPDDPGWFYVAKVETGPDGQDVLLGDVGGTLSHPYPVTYEADGSLTLTTLEATVPQWLPAGIASPPGAPVSDLAGGVIVGGASRFNANGYPLWSTAGAPSGAAWVSDGQGGAIGAALASGALIATRTSVNGARPWGPGVTVCSTIGTPANPVAIGDGMGGAYFVWTDLRNGAEDLYAQHVDDTGQPTWALDGIPVCVAPGAQGPASIATDGIGGAVVAWSDARPGAAGGADLYAQRLDVSGAPLWTRDGVSVCAATGVQEDPVFVGGGAAGPIVAWTDARAGDRDVYAQRLGSIGVARWTRNGVAVARGPGDQEQPALVADPAGDVLVIWQERRSAGDDEVDVLAQRMDAYGGLRWPAPGIPVCTRPGAQVAPSAVPDGAGGVIVAWRDARDRVGSGPALYASYAQRLDPDGAALWTPDGVRIGIAAPTPSVAAPALAGDREGGAYVDDVGGLQRVLPDGRPAWTPSFTPTIVGVDDVPADEGGHVRITVAAPRAQVSGYPPAIEQYELWRRVASRSSQSASTPPDGWELVTRFSPAGAQYVLQAPTRGDATAAGVAPEVFSVAALTGSPTLFLASDPVSGQSIDNLAPAAPEHLGGGHTPAGVRLLWSPAPEADVAHYNVYRAATPEFVPSDTNRVGRPTVPSWDDAFDPLAVYKVTAVDRHGNESPASSIAADEITGEVPAPPADIDFLGQPSPNPTTGAITFAYGVARPGPVTLAIYDLAGRNVRTLLRWIATPGEKQARWDGRGAAGRRLPAGLYLIRMLADGREWSRKVVLAN